MQVDVRLKRDRTGKPNTTWHNKMTSTLLRKRLYRLGKGIGAESDAIAYGSKVLKADLTVRDDKAFTSGIAKGRSLVYLL